MFDSKRVPYSLAALGLSIGMAAIPSVAYAAQNWSVSPTGNFYGSSSGTVTFWGDFKNRFTADVSVSDALCDSRGSVASFNVYTMAIVYSGETRKFYNDAGCGRTEYFPNEIISWGHNLRTVRAKLCSYAGDEIFTNTCYNSSSMDNPHTDNPDDPND